MSKLQKQFALGAIAVFGLYLIFGSFGQSLFNCQSALLNRSESPDGQYLAAIGVETCKDSSRDGVFLFFANLETGANVQRTLTRDMSITGFEFNWLREDELEIAVPSDVEWDDLQLQGGFERVKVEYRKGDSTVELSN